MTYNVNWEADPAAGIDAILACDADVVCLQETNRRNQAWFEARLAGRYAFATFLHSDTRTGGGSAIFARWPGKDVAHVRSDTGWFDARILAIETNVGTVQVLNVHLKPPICDEKERFALGAWWRAGSERQREIERFCEPLSPQCATIIAGDFNELERGRAVRWVRSRGYRNALGQFDRRAHTWSHQLGPITLRRRMDHIFHCRRLRCVDARVIRAGASDHWPVTATFEKCN